MHLYHNAGIRHLSGIWVECVLFVYFMYIINAFSGVAWRNTDYNIAVLVDAGIQHLIKSQASAIIKQEYVETVRPSSDQQQSASSPPRRPASASATLFYWACSLLRPSNAAEGQPAGHALSAALVAATCVSWPADGRSFHQLPITANWTLPNYTLVSSGAKLIVQLEFQYCREASLSLLFCDSR